MPWPAILIALGLASAFAGLVILHGWQPWIALLAVAGGAVLFSLALVLLALCLADDREGVWRAFTTRAQCSVRQVLRYFWH